MDILKIEATKDSPNVLLDLNSSIFEIAGKSHPENIKEFFKPIMEWLEEFHLLVKASNKYNIVVKFNYIYINSSSYKYIIIFLKKLKELENDGVNFKFFWYYEDDDDDMKESGQELFELSELGFDFELVPYIDED